MATQMFVPGPCAVYLNIGTALARNWQFLGWSQQGVPVSIREYHEPVHCDLAGPMLPYDHQFHGRDAQIVLDLSKYDHAVLTKLKAGVRTLQDSATGPGYPANPARPIGTMMRLEGETWELLLKASYANKTVFSAASMPGWYLFHDTFPTGSVDFQVSARAKVERITMHAQAAVHNTDMSMRLYTQFAYNGVGALGSIPDPS